MHDSSKKRCITTTSEEGIEREKVRNLVCVQRENRREFGGLTKTAIDVAMAHLQRRNHPLPFYLFSLSSFLFHPLNFFFPFLG